MLTYANFDFDNVLINVEIYKSIIHSLRMLTKIVSKWNFIVKCYPDILYCNNISQYIWSNNCSLGEHKTFKNIKKYNLKIFNWSVCTHTHTIFVYDKQVMVVSHSGWMWCRLKTQAYIQYICKPVWISRKERNLIRFKLLSYSILSQPRISVRLPIGYWSIVQQYIWLFYLTLYLYFTSSY